MSCNNCGNTRTNTKKCGCKDTALTTIPTFECPPGNCPVPPVCSEIFNSNCITYQGASITDLPVLQGMSVQAFIQMMTLYLTNPSSVTGVCQSSFNLYPTAITSTSISMAWDPSPTAVRYILQYKPASSMVWLEFPSQTTLQGVISFLTPDTVYNVRLKSYCSEVGDPDVFSFSVTLTIKTNN